MPRLVAHAASSRAGESLGRISALSGTWVPSGPRSPSVSDRPGGTQSRVVLVLPDPEFIQLCDLVVGDAALL